VQKLQEILRSRDYGNKSTEAEHGAETTENEGSYPLTTGQKRASHQAPANDISDLDNISPPLSNKSTFSIPRKRLGEGHELPTSQNISGTQSNRGLSPGNKADSGVSTQLHQSHPPSPQPDQVYQNLPSQKSLLPKSNLIEPSLLLSYLSQPLALRPSILLLDVRHRDDYEKGCLNAKQVVWIDPIILDEEYLPSFNPQFTFLRKSGRALEESLVLSPKEQQLWFANRHQFDLVVMYDEDSRVNSYAGGPTLDQHQVRLRNLTVAIFDFAGYTKPLKHVPMLLVGGIRAWCRLVRENPFRPVQWDVSESGRAGSFSSKTGGKEISRRPVKTTKTHTTLELDLDAESRWLQSIHLTRFHNSC
jgi:ubiquitin carboxyl-terminal hydrolase 8